MIKIFDYYLTRRNIKKICASKKGVASVPGKPDNRKWTIRVSHTDGSFTDINEYDSKQEASDDLKKEMTIGDYI